MMSFRVVLCRIRLFPILITKLKCPEPPLKNPSKDMIFVLIRIKRRRITFSTLNNRARVIYHQGHYFLVALAADESRYVIY